ncbi:MAG TPA: CocE/NonD family hydrolase, partial [Thermoanaerobaculia bacterium]|nr:CocE/NonD family hydrolase [Thermoanaerobaculia bacterium]
QSTVEDLAKWDRNFYEPKVGGPALVEQLQRIGLLNDGGSTGYAGGLFVSEHRGLRRVAHGGNWDGYAAQMIRFPGERLSVIALCNQENANPTRMGMQVAEIYLGDRLQPEPPAISITGVEKPTAEPFSPTPADLAAYVGSYFSEELDATYTLAIEEGRLVSRTGRQNHQAPLEPVSPDAFGKPDGALLRFSRSGKEVTGFSIEAGRARNLGFSRVPPVSRLGEYKGYSELVYDGWERTSFYIPTRDGTRLAVDLFRPTLGGIGGKPAAERLPVIWTANRYQRAMIDEGKLYTILDNYGWMADLLRHGYVIAVLDVRGAGASFGTFGGMFTRQETQDSYDVTEWLGTQPWSNGKVGMYGGSYLGFTQYMAAGQVPPHLAAIVPEKGGADLYNLLWNGGIFRAAFIERWTGLVRELDVDKPAPPVDGPEGEALLRAAVAGHRANRSMAEISAALPFRDSVDAKTGIRPWIEWSPITYRKEIERSGVAIYHVAGWFDRYVTGQTVLFKNLDNPQRITIGPWSHVQDHELDSGAEHHRFYDYWLKGIDNGIAKEDPVHYYVMGSGWRSARQWPLPEEKRTSYWFAADGRLTPEAPSEKGRDTLAVDYSASVWPAPRWSLEATYPEDLSANDAKGITYTTPPLTATVEVTGHPVVRLWVSADVADADLFVYLEEVDAKGASHYVTEGSLRASHRATADPGFDYLGMPWHRSFAADAAPLPKGEPVELAFDLFPTSNLFDAGHRIRVTVTGSDKANALTPEQTPPPRLVLHREKGLASHIVLPIIPARR